MLNYKLLCLGGEGVLHLFSDPGCRVGHVGGVELGDVGAARVGDAAQAVALIAAGQGQFVAARIQHVISGYTLRASSGPPGPGRNHRRTGFRTRPCSITSSLRPSRWNVMEAGVGFVARVTGSAVAGGGVPIRP